MTTTFSIAIQNASAAQVVPDRFSLQRWVDETLQDKLETAEMCIRIVDEEESQQLNMQYREKNQSTNVLAFPVKIKEDLDQKQPYIGDLVICAPVVTREAIDQDKALMTHWAHIVIHGTLHLLGYDHIKDDEAEIMEGIEIEIMQRLGFTNPYETEEN